MAKKVFLNLGLLLLFCMAGCLGGIFIGSSSGGPDNTRWQQMTPPPEKAVRIVEIRGSGSDANSITVQTVTDHQYECCGTGPSPWKEVTSLKTWHGMECSQIQSSLLDQLSGKLVDCAYITQFEYDSEQYYAALMDDGSLWRWHYLTGFSPITTGISNGLLAGLVIGGGIYRGPVGHPLKSAGRGQYYLT